MIPIHARSGRSLSLIILLAFLVTAGYQVSGGTNLAGDPDTVIIISTLFLVAVIVFCAVWKYENACLQAGLALIIYALGVDLIEEFTADFTFTETFLLALLLVFGFILLIHGIFTGVREIDQNNAYLRRQEAELRTRSEDLAAAGAALERTNKKLRLLTQITRHDIGNRLLTASGYLALAQNNDLPEEKARYLEKVDRSLEAIREIIAFTKTYEEIGLAPSRWQRIHSRIDEAAHLLKHDTVMIENAVDPAIEIFSDGMVGKVFFNLIDNALAHGGPALAQIRFSARTEGTGLVILCENDGEGIPEDKKAEIFERGIGSHTGLGLFLTREILSITTISIRETGDPAHGARFEIFVPEGTYRYSSGTADP